MLRKAAQIVFLFVWSVTALGLVISRHYCGDNLVSVSVNSEAPSCCGADCGCCHNENEQIGLEDDYLAEQELKLPALPDFEKLFPQVYCYITNLPDEHSSQKIYHILKHPPPQSRPAMSELQVFRC